jgi:hypothetical protein
VTPRDLGRRLPTAAGWIAGVVPLVLVLMSVALAPGSSRIARAALLALGVLAIARPDAALLLPIALANFGIILAHLAGMPTLRTTEVLVVLCLAGFAIRACGTRGSFRGVLAAPIAAPAALLAITAIASAIVWQRVYYSDAMAASTYGTVLWQFLTRSYFVEPDNFLDLVSTAVLLEGLALCLVVAVLCQEDSTFFDRATRMMVVGGAGLGVLSGARLAEVLIRNPGAIEALRATSLGLRISPQIPDFIAAGSYFALCWLTSLGIAQASPRARLLWLTAGVPLIGAIYLTGSRSVIGAAGAGLVVPALVAFRQKGVSTRALQAFAVLTVVAMVLSYSWMTGRDVSGRMAQQSLTVRGELLKAGGHIIATRPVFGIGIDRFYQLAPVYASPQLRALWQGRMNPHNDFLRFAAELGLVGGAAFLWILIAAGKRIWDALARTRDARLSAVAGGLVAFLVTSLFSNPLMVRDVSYVFWIALGLAVGYSTRLLRPAEEITNGAAERAASLPRWRWAAVLVVGGVLLISIPSRTVTELALVDPTRVSHGFYEWNTEADGTRWRWCGARATLFVDSRARIVEIPLSSRPSSEAPQTVEIWLDGRLANRVSLGPDWQRVRMILRPAASIEPRRIDFTVSPTWVPAQVIPGSQERRIHGVRVGEVSITKLPNKTP